MGKINVERERGFRVKWRAMGKKGGYGGGGDRTFFKSHPGQLTDEKKETNIED